jgi:hypothetical protein
MRFLIGLFTGAVLTLLIATAMDAPTHPILTGAKDLATEVWDGLISSTSDSLFETGKAEEPVPELAEPAAADGADAEAFESFLREAAELPVLTGTEYEAAEPAVALAPPGPIDQPPSSAFRVAEDTATLNEASAASEPTETSPVWVPFHSQMSAKGFATRLSLALDREFRVERQGAGAYQVVFDAADAGDRALILAEVSEITGQ